MNNSSTRRGLPALARWLVYLFVVAAVLFAWSERSRLASLQRQVDDDLLVLTQRRAALQTKQEDLEQREKAVAERESALRVAVQQQQQQPKAVVSSSVSLSPQQTVSVTPDPSLPELLRQKRQLRRLEKQAAAAGAAVSHPDLPPVMALHRHDGQHGHARLNAQQVPAGVPSSIGPFQVNASATAPEFLEGLAKEWGFARDGTQDVGLLTLMPWPTKLSFAGRKFVAIAAGTRVSVTWAGDTSDFARAATERLQTRLAAVSRPLKAAVCPHPGVCVWETAHPVELRVVVTCKRRAPAVPVVQPNERYALRVAADGVVSVEAEEAVGVLRAFATLVQLVTRRPQGDASVFVPVVTIEDGPMYSWRGLLLDVARNFHPVEQVLRLLDGMELVKLNVLHWHLSDDQGFRVEVSAFPNLHRAGSGGGSEYYRQEQIERVVRAASLRGIRVVPEIDMPGHVGAIVLAHPELASGTVPRALDTAWGVRPYVLDISKPLTYTWIETLLGEMVALFPDEYFHIGGDEVPHTAWQTGEMRSWMQANGLGTLHDAQLHFNRKLLAILTRLKRKMVGWDDIVVDSLPKDVTIQLWRGWMPDVISNVARLGLPAVSSIELYLDWARPVKHYYRHNVQPQPHRLGGEACMWSEWASANIDNRIWPTLAAVAEKLWLSVEAPGGLTQMYGRLFGVADQLTLAGVPHAAVLDAAVDALVTGREFSFEDVLLRHAGDASQRAPDPAVRRLVNALQPINRVSGGQKHPLVELADALRPDSLEMRALAALCEQCASEKFADAPRAALLRASLELYAQLPKALASRLSTGPLAAAAGVVRSIGSIGQHAVELLDALAAGDKDGAQRRRAALLAEIQGAENAEIDRSKLIVEFAHVVETSLCIRV